MQSLRNVLRFFYLFSWAARINGSKPYCAPYVLKKSSVSRNRFASSEPVELVICLIFYSTPASAN
jgi:hypothetical protein